MIFSIIYSLPTLKKFNEDEKLSRSLTMGMLIYIAMYSFITSSYCADIINDKKNYKYLYYVFFTDLITVHLIKSKNKRNKKRKEIIKRKLQHKLSMLPHIYNKMITENNRESVNDNSCNMSIPLYQNTVRNDDNADNMSINMIPLYNNINVDNDIPIYNENNGNNNGNDVNTNIPIYN